MGMLVPVAGFVQVGMQSMADRYTYLPLVGIFLVLARAVGEAVGRLPAARIPAAVACGAALLALTGAARAQVGSWADTETLYRHAAEAVPGNWFAHQGLAGLAIRDGRRDEALSHLRAVLRVGPAYNDFQYSVFRGRGGGGEDEAAEFLREVDRWNLADAARMRQFGLAKAAEGRLSEAEHFFRTAVRIRPGLAEAHYDLGTALERRGKRGEAREHFRQALRIDPSDADAKNRIGVALVRLERWGESIPWFRAALRERPAHEDARFNLAIALDRTGARPEALLRLREYLRLRPGDPAAASTLAEWEGR
jgi:tetratricopeptide (TPR) repeat protein